MKFGEALRGIGSTVRNLGLQARLREVGTRVPDILFTIARLTAVLIFVWYFWELASANYGHLWPVRVGAGVSLAAFIFLAAMAAAKPPTASAASGGGFVVLVLTPLSVIAMLTALCAPSHDFKSDLINITAAHMRALWQWLSQ